MGPVPLCRTEWQRRKAACQQRRKVPDVGEFSCAALAVEPVDDFAADVGISGEHGCRECLPVVELVRAGGLHRQLDN